MLDATALEEHPTLNKAQTEERRRLAEWLDTEIEESKKKPRCHIVTVVPALARLILEHNPVNRPIQSRNASTLASDIASGRFMFNGESIVISNTGVLIDGQHRLLQVIATNTPIEAVMVFGPEEEARFTIDIGAPKTVSNFLAMKGKSYTASLAAAANYHLQWRKNGLLITGGTNVPTKLEIMAAVDETRGLETSVEFTVPCMKTVRSHAVLAFCHYVFWKKSARENADHFILRLIEGDGLKKGDPVLYCRNRLLGMGRMYAANTRCELIFKCWNAYRLGAPLESHFKLNGGKLPKVER